MQLHFVLIMNSNLAQMLEFGFEEEPSSLALWICDGDLESAVNLAATNSVE